MAQLEVSGRALDLASTRPLITPGPPGATGSLAWRPGEEPAGPPLRTLRDFERALHSAGLLDLAAIPLAGAQVALPAGVALFRRFGELVRSAYESIGLTEYDYPFVGPTSIYAPIIDLLGDKAALLHVGTERDLANGKSSATLSPSGEATVYHHWAQIVRTEADLPIGAYRQARYYRPAHRSRQAALFRPLEACDVYELHWAVADPAAAEERLRLTYAALGQVADALAVPLLWMVRPPWTNHSAVSDATIAGDCLLPHGQTLQLATIYDQSTRFAERFGIRFRIGSALHFVHQVAGAITRRTVIAHLWLSAPPVGGLLAHSLIASIHVVVLYPEDEHHWAHAVALELRNGGLRTAIESTGPRQLRAAIARWRSRGVAATVILRAAQTDRPATATVVRGDDRSRVEVSPDAIAGATMEAVVLADASGVYRSLDRVRRALRPVHVADEARAVVGAGGVAVVPCVPSAEAVEFLRVWEAGDVLGFRRGERSAACVATRQATDVVALLARYV